MSEMGKALLVLGLVILSGVMGGTGALVLVSKQPVVVHMKCELGEQIVDSGMTIDMDGIDMADNWGEISNDPGVCVIKRIARW